MCSCCSLANEVFPPFSFCSGLAFIVDNPTARWTRSTFFTKVGENHVAFSSCLTLFGILQSLVFVFHQFSGLPLVGKFMKTLSFHSADSWGLLQSNLSFWFSSKPPEQSVPGCGMIVANFKCAITLINWVRLQQTSQPGIWGHALSCHNYIDFFVFLLLIYRSAGWQWFVQALFASLGDSVFWDCFSEA